ncbi:ParA family protein [Vagococcus elongatus]|uniref:AAA domain-containing protein n=1 Tax=Vagococcus elongatus TaxID=180344 RepID=A0A430AW81_9ENTE|nr:AAA family ATPase [Vagococcus elongatus]RSU12313.1 hypothetical protein CBF29_06845 [Vagococcus elongatus]
MAVKLAAVNNKGGSTKTTTIVNLAGALTYTKPNAKILLVEGDAQGNASTSFRIESKKLNKSIYDVFMGNAKAEDCVVNAFQNIDIIPANNDMNFLEFDEMTRFEQVMTENMYKLSKQMESENVDISSMDFETFKALTKEFGSPTQNYFNMLSGKLDELDKKYDYIFFDTPPELKAVTSSILAICDYVLIPFEPELYAMDGLENILSRINAIKKEYNPKLEVAGLLATKVKGNTKLHAEVTKGVMMFCMRNKINYYQTEISNSIRFADSNAFHGVPATIAKPKNDFSLMYYSLLDEMTNQGIL